MFPDSEIAKKYGCAATKTAAIINYAIAPSLHSPLIEYLQQNPFSLAIDGSSDTGTENMHPLVVRIYDVNKGKCAHDSGTCAWYLIAVLRGFSPKCPRHLKRAMCLGAILLG